MQRNKHDDATTKELRTDNSGDCIPARAIKHAVSNAALQLKILEFSLNHGGQQLYKVIHIGTDMHRLWRFVI